MKNVCIILSIFVATTLNRLTPEKYFYAMNASNEYVLLDVRMYEKYQEERISGALYAGEKTFLNDRVNNTGYIKKLIFLSIVAKAIDLLRL